MYDVNHFVKNCLGMLVIGGLSTSLNGQSINRIDPPNWFTGLNVDTLELLVYGENLDKVQNLSLDGPNGAQLIGWKPSESANYLLATIWLNKNVEPGEYVLKADKSRKKGHTWSIKPKSNYSPQSPHSADVVYLISPDRFVNGDPKNDAFKNLNESTIDRKAPFGRHGGDIQGILNKLDYLEDLGITTVWNCPLLENNQPKESYHGYAITDFYTVDPRFGSNLQFVELGEKLHARNMKLIMDVVFNHCGSMHPFHTNPPFKNWINHWPEYTQTNYRAEVFVDPHASEYDTKHFQDGWFVPTMPDLNQRDPHLARYMIQNTIWWITTAGLDGLRIDTYAYPDQEFMNRMIMAVHKVYPDFFMTGEIWVSGHQIQGGFTSNPALGKKTSLLPSVLDFQFCFSAVEMAKEPAEWDKGLGKLYMSLVGDWMYTHPEKLVTFIDNHDLARVYGQLNQDFSKWKLAMGVLLTSRGIPCVYYGSEILMKETASHGVIRQDFPGGWSEDTVNKFESAGRMPDEEDAFNYIRTLANFRKQSPHLFSGKFVHFVPIDGIYVYFWTYEDDIMMCVLNRSEVEKNIDFNRFKEILSGDKELTSLFGNYKIKAGTTNVIPALSFDVYVNR